MEDSLNVSLQNLLQCIMRPAHEAVALQQALEALHALRLPVQSHRVHRSWSQLSRLSDSTSAAALVQVWPLPRSMACRGWAWQEGNRKVVSSQSATLSLPPRVGQGSACA